MREEGVSTRQGVGRERERKGVVVEVCCAQINDEEGVGSGSTMTEMTTIPTQRTAESDSLQSQGRMDTKKAVHGEEKRRKDTGQG